MTTHSKDKSKKGTSKISAPYHRGSYWTANIKIPERTALHSNPSVDVCIIGAGIAGLTAAYLLLKEGLSVIVLEQGKIAGGETGRTTAHLSFIMDDGLTNMEKWHGLEGAKKIAQSHSDAISLIEKIIRDENIECDFSYVDAYLFSGDESVTEDLSKDLSAAQRAQIKVEQVKHTPIDNFESENVLKFPNQAQFHVIKYLKSLAQIINDLGGKIYEETHVTEIKQGQPAEVVTAKEIKVKSKFVIEAANSLVSGSAITITKLFPYRTFAIAVTVPKDSVMKALYWDTEDPYHYVRVQPFDEHPEYDLLIIGGEDHKTGQANDAEHRYQALEIWGRKLWPQMLEVKYRWSGQVLETLDGLALIGRNPGNKENSLLITGDSGHGITHGTLGAMILTDRILGRQNPYSELYSPSRFHSRSLGHWLKENVNVAKQYMDWFTKNDVKSIEKISKGEGAVISQGLSKVAVYKDAKGKVHTCSAVCTHLGGIVSWNSEEKSWDCPCHGSRFNAFGKVITTPATEDLKLV